MYITRLLIFIDLYIKIIYIGLLLKHLRIKQYWKSIKLSNY